MTFGKIEKLEKNYWNTKLRVETRKKTEKLLEIDQKLINWAEIDFSIIKFLKLYVISSQNRFSEVWFESIKINLNWEKASNLIHQIPINIQSQGTPWLANHSIVCVGIPLSS